ncbi:MAG TPA: arginine--tRNA ligase [Candidatus Saccharimonadales bacterium]|nr:arginine--tRNA ligase [Candidatus Saccharimonadales bacterium]
MIDQIKNKIAKLVADSVKAESVEVQPANPKFGADFAIPCFKIAAEQKTNPVELAKKLAEQLKMPELAKVEAAGGFVNLWLSDDVLLGALKQVDANFGSHKTFKDKEILIEHTAVNPFKEFHIGHAYANTIGEALARLHEAAGAKVHQISYHGDVGPQIAMPVWGAAKMLAANEGDWYDNGDPAGRTMSDVAVDKRIAFLGAAYAKGAAAFKEDEESAAEIKAINKHIYLRDDEGVDEIYSTGSRWSFDYFDDVCDQLKSGNFEKHYLESEMGPIGAEIVKSNLGDVFEESNGAIVYNGEQKAGLHTRVFINGQGLPTYEAKELGLTFTKQNDYPQMTQTIVVTGNEIDEYFKVLIAAVSELDPSLGAKMKHISHGMVKLSSGKMSSRTGKVLSAVDVLNQVKQAISDNYQTEAIDDVKLAAIKYAFLKQRISGDVIFDINESVSLEGNSGPYIQYAHARGQSILAKSQVRGEITDLNAGERILATKILEYPAATAKAINELAPHNVCTYLYELTQTFNRFYEKNRVIDDPREATRIALVAAYCQVLKNGLSILNIAAPEKL